MRVNAEHILNMPLTKQKRPTLNRLAKKPDAEIDFSDIPPLSDKATPEAPFGLFQTGREHTLKRVFC